MGRSLSKIRYYDDSFHDYFIDGDWNLEKIKNDFGDTPSILTSVLERRSCSVDVIQLLLKQGEDINCPNNDGVSPLEVALEISNDEKVIRVLLEGGAEVNMVHSFGRNPLLSYLIREDCSASIVEVLLDFKADVNQKDTWGDSPLTTAIRNAKDDAVIRVLVERGAEVNDLRNLHNTPLLVLLQQRKNCSVDTVKLLLAKGADINCMDKYVDPPLVSAIKNERNAEVIQLLLEKGADANKFGKCGDTPLSLYLGSDNCSSDIVKLLLHYGADVNCKNFRQDYPLTTALKYFRDETIIRMLLEKGAKTNVVVGNGDTPLLLCIGRYFNHNCSSDIVKLLLHYNADVNCLNYNEDFPLGTALKYSRDEKIIRMLLEAGAEIDTLDCSSKSPLCIAFSYSSNDIVKLLLDAGASPNACKYHRSALYCATDYSYPVLREDILKLLLEANVDVNSVDKNGQSALCHALRNGAKSCDIQLLLDVGASLNTCELHSSPVFCATGTLLRSILLREDVVQLLLDNGACVKDEDLEVVLQNALRCQYETGAIQLLLDLPGMNSYIVSNKSLLHDAVSNPNCKPDVIKLLINRTAHVQSEDQSSETPLHCAARYKIRDSSVIDLLLKNGAQVNAKNELGETPLTLAVNGRCHASILKELLFAGARIGESKFRIGYGCASSELLVFLAHEWDACTDENIISCYKLLTKFFLLQNPDFNLENFQRAPVVRSCCIEKLKNFLNECLNELRKMNLLQVGRGRTFQMFVRKVDCVSVEKNYVNRVLVYLMKNRFPVFFDVISARMDRSVIEAEFKKLPLYSYKQISKLQRGKVCPARRVYLNCDILCHISKYLPNEALLNYILAFYKPVDQNNIGEASKNITVLGKRKSEASTPLLKHPKLHC